MNKGALTFHYGTMFAGKSLGLLATAHSYEEASFSFLTIKSELDTRDGDNIIHSRALGDRDCLTISQEDDLYAIISMQIEDDVINGYNRLEYILVDEAQFLTPLQVEQLGALVDNFGITVECYGLKTDFRGELFPGSKRLFEIADVLKEIERPCKCGNNARFNARIDSYGNIITDGELIDLGGAEKYVTLCRKCFFTKTGHYLYGCSDE